MLKGMLTAEELNSLLENADAGTDTDANKYEVGESYLKPEETEGSDDRTLLHALIRNQLRLMLMVEELQSEVRQLKASLDTSRARFETSSGLEAIPFPFLKPSAVAEENDAERQAAPAADVTRKERYKRKSFWV